MPMPSPASSDSPSFARSATPPASWSAPDAVEAVAWADRDLDWLALSLGYLRRVVPALVRIDPPRVAGTHHGLK